MTKDNIITNNLDTNVGIIGVGKLGLVYALSFERRGLNVWASSYKKEYVDDLQNKKTNTTEPLVAQRLELSKNIKFTVDNHEVLNHCDMIYVMVATPSLPEGNYDISAVHEVVNDVLNHAGSVENKILIVGSTVNPGDCVQLQHLLSARGVQLVYAPTFAAQGSVCYDIENPYALMLGSTHAPTAERCKQLFSNIIPSDTPVHVLHPTSGEIMKIAANCYSTMKISYFNMIGQLMITSGLTHDIKTANEYLSEADHRQTHLRFGFGYGGPCYPRDNKSLQHYSKKIGMDFPYAQVNDEFNQAHIQFLTNYFLQQNKHNLPFYFRYISYKPGVNIFEESHQLEVCKQLLAQGCKVFVEPTEFLGAEIQKDLTDHWGNQIEFVSLQTLQTENQSIHVIDL
jgi:nucleotide sugar dehydrogenase